METLGNIEGIIVLLRELLVMHDSAEEQLVTVCS